ncbi:thiamine pyrophosphate-dependent enzyme [Allostella humosa]|nr:thiamine pyrophosphate-dependent enzyme [Stella humosa]
MSGGDALVATLIEHGVTVGFTVPGESFLAVLEALRRARNSIRLVNARHEGSAAFAAEAYGKIALKPAAVFVSRGPGATNASIGIHTAMQDSTPLLLFVGDVPRRVQDREAFQGVDYRRFFGAIAKAVIQPFCAEDVAEATARAWRTATSGRPGPVVVVLPEDVTEAEFEGGTIPRPPRQTAAGPSPDALADAVAAIAGARQPVIVCGEMVALHRAHDALVRFADRTAAPVLAAFRRQDCFPNAHPAYAGHLGLTREPYIGELWATADVVVAVGSRLDDMTTEEFTFVRPDQTMVLLHPDPDVAAAAGAAVHLAADLRLSLDALTAALPAAPNGRLAVRDAVHAREAAHAGFAQRPSIGAVDMVKVVEAVAAQVPDDALIATDAGTFGSWVYRHYPWRQPSTQVAPEVGAMGAGVPGAIGASLARPDATVVAFVGDGGFLMTGSELATAVEEAVPVKVVLCDNAAYASILIHQHRRYGAEAYHGVTVKSPDFALLARGYGAAAWTVRETAEFAPAFRAALAHDGPALVHVLTDVRDGSANGPLQK